MQQGSRPESRESSRQFIPGKESRSGSITALSLVAPPRLLPEPQYIAASAASQIVNSEYVSRGPNWLDSESPDDGAGVTVAPASLILVNAFLDQLLFSFLKGARSTAIVALKPAIHDVLKPRLAKDAIQGADDELKGYLTGGDDEELNDFHGGQELKGERNLQRIFRRTRLRCMVYTRLGDMEEEDEDIYLEGEHVEDTTEDRHHVSRDLGTVSPAAAIFLTSIIEFIGEQALMIAGEAAYTRLGSRKPALEDRRPTVEEGDIEKIAFNTTLGRLWRSWRSKSRPSSGLSRRPSSSDFQGRKSSMSAGDMISRTTSVDEADETGAFGATPRNHDRNHDRTIYPIPDDRDPASIPLPQPRGLPEEPDFGSDEETVNKDKRSRRPRSLVHYPSAQASHQHAERQGSAEQRSLPVRPERPHHRRSSSLPTLQTAYQSPMSERFVTPSERLDPFSEDGKDDEIAPDEMPSLTNVSDTVPSLQKEISGVTTMYDGLLGSELASAHPSIRGVSMLSEISSTGATDGFDHENDMTPQALNLNKELALPQDGSSVEPSRASTMSTEYDFGAGETPTGIFGSGHRQDRGAAVAAPPPVAASTEDIASPSGASKNVTNLATVHGEDRLRTYDDNGTAVKRDIPVLYEAPSNQDVIYDPQASTKNLKDDETVSASSSYQSEGPPLLTPLRELRDAALDTSDESSLNDPSNEDYRFDDSPTIGFSNNIPLQAQREITGLSDTYQAMPVPNASEPPALRSQPAPINAGVGRAGVQRLSPSTSKDHELMPPFGRTSTSSNRDARPTTAGSATSKLHRTMSKESGPQARQIIPRRSSSEKREQSSNAYRTTSHSDKMKDFESLIHSDETIQYTLTPQNMREMEDPDSPRWSQRQSPAINGVHRRTISTEQNRSPVDRSPKSLKGANGLRSNPTNGSSVTDFASPSKNSPPVLSRAFSGGPVPKSPNGPPSSRPRDPALKDASTRDFADFIRSTGPDVPPTQTPKASAVTDAAHSRQTSADSQPANTAAKNLPQKMMKQQQQPVMTPVRTSEDRRPSRAGTKLQAREPIASPTNTTAELADFFRSGPPGGTDGTHQPQRTQPTNRQAPVHTNGMSNGRKIGSHSSVASTQDGYAPSKMTQSSVNSRTGLLESKERASSGPTHMHRLPQNGEIEDGPARKQRRVKDPYALDSDDEDDHGHGAVASTGRAPRTEQPEESLSDFLRDYDPPPEGSGARFVPRINTNAPTSTSDKHRKASGANIRDRITRNVTAVPNTRPLPPRAPEKDQSASPQSGERRQPGQRTAANPASASPKPRSLSQSRTQTPKQTSPSSNPPQLPPMNPRSSSPHLISQSGSKFDGIKPTHPTYAPQIERPRVRPQARNELDSSKGGGGGMGDLADFLRETEPPAPSGPALNNRNGVRPVPSKGAGGLDQKKSGGGGIGKMFGRKKKV